MSFQELPPGGQKFGRYRLIATLGHGGMSTVHLAVGQHGPKNARELVVLKLLNENLQDSEDFAALFAREARIAGELAHENIVQSHTLGAHEGRQYIIMEYLRGVSLGAIMRQSQEWSFRDRLPLLGAMCLALTGLHYAHEFRDHRGQHLRLVHRDFKPDNVFITTEGRVKLLDFGVAKVNSPEFEKTLGTSLRGTVQYMAPEALQPEREVDRRADLFAAGVMIAELATGQRFWGDKPYTQILRQLSDCEIPGLPETPEEEVLPALARLCERALAPEPDDRFTTALELRQALMKVLRAQGYRIDVEDLAAIVQPLSAPGEKEREVAVRCCLEAVDGVDTGLATAAVSDETAPATTPDGMVGESTETGMKTTAPLPPPVEQEPRRGRGLLLFLLPLLLLPVGWYAWSQLDRAPLPGDRQPAPAGMGSPAAAPQQPAPRSVPVTNGTPASPTPNPSEVPADSPPSEASSASGEPADEAQPPTAVLTPTAETLDESDKRPTVTTPRRRRRRRRDRAPESVEPSVPAAPVPAPKPTLPPPEKKSEMEANPYAR